VEPLVARGRERQVCPAFHDYLWKIPGKQYAEGSFRTLVSGLRIPQVSETYAYFIDECPQTHFSNMIINEWGVAFGSNGCASKEDPNEILEKNGKYLKHERVRPDDESPRVLSGKGRHQQFHMLARRAFRRG